MHSFKASSHDHQSLRLNYSNSSIARGLDNPADLFQADGPERFMLMHEKKKAVQQCDTGF